MSEVIEPSPETNTKANSEERTIERQQEKHTRRIWRSHVFHVKMCTSGHVCDLDLRSCVVRYVETWLRM